MHPMYILGYSKMEEKRAKGDMTIEEISDIMTQLTITDLEKLEEASYFHGASRRNAALPTP